MREVLPRTYVGDEPSMAPPEGSFAENLWLAAIFAATIGASIWWRESLDVSTSGFT